MTNVRKTVVTSWKITLLAGGIALAGCASTPLQLPSETAIQQAQQEGTLEAMYADLRLRSKLDPNAAKLSKRIGGMIADQKYDATLTALENAKIGGAVPIALLNAKSSVVEVISPFSTTVAEKLKAWLSQQNETTQTAIKTANALIQDNEASLAGKLDAADVSFGLRGENPADLKQKLLSNAYNAANSLEVAGDYEGASQSWVELLDVAPDFRDVSARYEAVSGTFRVDQFNSLLTSGDADGAAKLYLDLASKGVDMTDFASGAEQLVGFYQLQLESALDDENYAAAMASAEDMQALVDGGVQAYIGDSIAALVESLILRAEVYLSQDQLGLGLGTLLAAKRLAPQEPLVLEMYEKTNEKVFDKSITRLSLGQFAGTGEFPQLGNRISSLIKESILERELSSVKLIERESLDAVFVEKELIAMKGGEVNTTVEAADIVIQGEVVAASVDESRQTRRKTKRVVVDIEKTANPAYQEWAALKESKRAKLPTPPQFNEKKIKEDVQISSEVVKLDGLVSVSYRLINPVTATIMSYESLEETNHYEGENTDGMEIGLFVQESVVADVPSQSQLVTELAQTVASKVSDSLAQRFSDPVTLFTAEADTYLEKDDDASAAMSLAKAFSVQTTAEESAVGIESRLVDLSLQSDAFLEN